MSREMFDILDEHGKKTGQVASRREVHYYGLWHAGMNLCVTDGRGNVFQQRRAGLPQVRELQNVWDLFFVAGHVQADEEPHDTLLRELEAEVGVRFTVEQLHDDMHLTKVSVTQSEYWVKDGSFPLDEEMSEHGFRHRVHDHNFVACMPQLDISQLNLDTRKVLEVRRYPITQLLRDVESPHSPAYHELAHRPPNDERLYDEMLREAQALEAA